MRHQFRPLTTFGPSAKLPFAKLRAWFTEILVLPKDCQCYSVSYCIMLSMVGMCPDPADETGGIGFDTGSVSISCVLHGNPVLNPTGPHVVGTICSVDCVDNTYGIPQGLPHGDNGQWLCDEADEGRWVKVQSGDLTQCADGMDVFSRFKYEVICFSSTYCTTNNHAGVSTRC